MIFAAIDPGAVHAAIAVFHDSTPVFVDDIRTANGMIDSATLAHALSDMKVERMVVENVHARPRVRRQDRREILLFRHRQRRNQHRI